MYPDEIGISPSAIRGVKSAIQSRHGILSSQSCRDLKLTRIDRCSQSGYRDLGKHAIDSNLTTGSLPSKRTLGTGYQACSRRHVSAARNMSSADACDVCPPRLVPVIARYQAQQVYSFLGYDSKIDALSTAHSIGSHLRTRARAKNPLNITYMDLTPHRQASLIRIAHGLTKGETDIGNNGRTAVGVGVGVGGLSLFPQTDRTTDVLRHLTMSPYAMFPGFLLRRDPS